MDETQEQAKQRDALIDCLLIIAKRNNPTYTRDEILSGLRINGNATNHSFITAASRANLTARLNKATIAKLYSTQLPGILLLNEGSACILEKISPASATITRPNTPDKKEDISLDELQKTYQGHYYHLKPLFKLDEHPSETNKKTWLWRVLIKQLPTYSEVIVASFLVNLFALVGPLFIMNVYDKVIPNQAFETLWTLALAVMLVFVFDFILRELRTYFIDLSSRNVDSWFSATLFEQLLDIKMAARPSSIGTLTNSMQSFESIKEFLSSTTVVAMVDFPFIITFLFIIFILGGWLVLIPLFIIPLVLGISFLNQMRTTTLVEQIIKLNSQKQSVLIETLQNIQAVKVSLSEGVLQHRFEEIVNKIATLGVKNRFYTNFSVNLSIFAQYFATVAIMVGGVYRITNGSMGLGGLIACTILAGRCLAPVIQLSNIFARYKQARASLDLINNILDLPIERPLDKSFLSLPEMKGNIEFRNISFTYPHQQKKQLDKVSFSIKAEERVGIIGLNGSGKTTILRLILKLYDPSEGVILVDGIESHQIDPAELRHYIGFLPQEVNLFQGTIKDNIKMGIMGVDDDMLLKATEMSGLSRFVMENEEGFQRNVGERGQAVSGGERQIIGLTRALMTNPPVLIMDEPTSSMDEIAVAKFTKNLENIASGKTVILVTHKLELLKLVTRLIVVHQGKIIADGPRDEVLARLGKTKETTHS